VANNKKIVRCLVCEKEEYVCPSRLASYKTCSKECSSTYRILQNQQNRQLIKCAICDKILKIGNQRISDSKTKEFCCSYECSSIHRKTTMAGTNNHQYGLKGSNNSSFKGDTRINIHGYELTYSPNHPFRDCDDKVRTHRLVAEEYLLTNDNSVEVNRVKYLNPKLEVHHIDEDKLNNNYNNLIILTKSEHMRLHGKQRNLQRGEDGRYIAQGIFQKYLVADGDNVTTVRRGGIGSTNYVQR